MNKVDVVIIGAGVTGSAIARQLSRYQLDVVLAEKQSDVSFGTSKANSGIIHAGFHHSASHLKARLEIQGNLMFTRLQKELGFPFKRCGLIVAALNVEELKVIEHLFQQGTMNQAIGLEMCSKERILDLEPKLNPDVIGGLYAPGGGIIEPYGFVFSLVESAKKNGVTILTDFHVVESEHTGKETVLYAENGEKISARWVINAAGVFADTVSALLHAESFTIRPRKGEYYLLDRMSKAIPGRVVFPVPTPVSKGMLVIPTVENTLLVGPTATDVEDKGDLSTSPEELAKIFNSARRLIPIISENDVITSFSGLRPALADGDFLIEVSKKQPRVIHVAGIQSPGLTASPAIAEYVKDLLKQAGCTLIEKNEYDPFIEPQVKLRTLSHYEADELLRRNPVYGNIVCRCEKVSEGEIVDAVRHGHTTLDGIKFYTRAGMGRCQGGFCTYKIIKILMRETGMTWAEVTKRGPGSEVLKGRL